MITLGANPLDDLYAQAKSITTQTYQAGKDLVTKELPAAAVKAVQAKASAVATPIVEQAAAAKAARVSAKGKVALMTVGGAALAGTLAWKRWYIGAPIGALIGAAVGWKIGWLSD